MALASPSRIIRKSVESIASQYLEQALLGAPDTQKGVLIGGIRKGANQFTRMCDDLNIPYEVWDCDRQSKFNHLPRFDALVLSEQHISHNSHEMARTEYKARGKPVFLAGHSAAAIKEELSQWWQSLYPNEQGDDVNEETLKLVMDQIKNQVVSPILNSFAQVSKDVESISTQLTLALQRIEALEQTVVEHLTVTDRVKVDIDAVNTLMVKAIADVGELEQIGVDVKSLTRDNKQLLRRIVSAFNPG